MMSTRSVLWLAGFLVTTVTVSAFPVEEKRAVGDWVTATIDGQIVSWINNWSGVPASAVSATATTAAASTWVTATIDGEVVSWINNWSGVAASAAPATTTTTAPPAAVPTTEATSVVASTTPTTATTTSAVASASTSTSASSCKDVHIFLARGWNEPYPGRQGKLAGAICSGLGSCDYEDIIFYDAAGSDYCTAVTEGDNNGVAQMAAYAGLCPNSKLVLTGYSEGAQVAGDVLGGGDSSCTSGYTGGLDPSTSPGNQIGAALLFGDPQHVANQPYNWLNGSDVSSTSPRSSDSLARMNKFSQVLRSYCDESDPVCASGGPGPFVTENHLNYFDRYTDEAAGWVKGMLGF